MPSEEIVLRPALETDIAGLIRLERRSWLVSWAPELPFDAVQRFAVDDPARKYVERTWRSLTVAIVNDELVGVLEVAADCVESLHVDPKSWSKGIGSALLKEAERRIAQTHTTARLEVRSFNERARDFYRRRGWIEIRTYPGTEMDSPIVNVEMTKVL